MSFSNAPLSAADIAAITGNGDGNGFGGNGAWWVIIILFAFFGWGRNGNGWGGDNGSGNGGSCCAPASCADLQRGFDANMAQQRFNGLEHGQCDLGYANAQLIAGVNQNLNTGFFGVQNALTQGFAGINTGLITQGYETRLATQDLSAQMESCCCDEKQLIQQGITQGVMNTSAIQAQLQQCCCDMEKEAMQTRYDMATDTCALQNTMHNNTRDIIENDNANWRALNERLTQMEMAQKDNKIAEQAAMIQALQSKTDMLDQSNYIINRLNPPAVPSYTVPNPNCCYPTQQYRGCCNNNNGCGY